MNINVQGVQRVSIKGPMGEIQSWYEELYSLGFKVFRSGPERTAIDKCNPNRFHVIAERTIEDRTIKGGIECLKKSLSQ